MAIAFESVAPCKATIEFGEDANYGKVFEPPKGTQRFWIDSLADLLEGRSQTRVTNCIALVAPLVESGKTYHYRIVLEDEFGNRTATADGTFALTGEPSSYFVSPAGRDVEGAPVDQFDRRKRLLPELPDRKRGAPCRHLGPEGQLET